MKNFALYAFTALLLVGMSSCQKQATEEDMTLVRAISESSGKVVTNPANLPNAIVEFMQEEHFVTYISEAYQSPTLGYELITGDEDHVFFNLEGRPLVNEEIEWREGEFRRFGGPCSRPGRYINPRRLPNAIKRYINANYPDNSPHRAKILANGMIVVGMDAPLMLVFTSEGRFVEEVFCIRPCEGAMQRVRLAELPAGIPEYLRTHYNGLEALAAYACRNGNFVIGLFVDGHRVIVVFDSEGNFLHVRG